MTKAIIYITENMHCAYTTNKSVKDTRDNLVQMLNREDNLITIWTNDNATIIDKNKILAIRITEE